MNTPGYLRKKTWKGSHSHGLISDPLGKGMVTATGLGNICWAHGLVHSHRKDPSILQKGQGWQVGNKRITVRGRIKQGCARPGEHAVRVSKASGNDFLKVRKTGRSCHTGMQKGEHQKSAGAYRAMRPEL